MDAWLDRAGNRFSASKRPRFLRGLVGKYTDGKVRIILLFPDTDHLSLSYVTDSLRKVDITSNIRCRVLDLKDHTPFSKNKVFNNFLQSSNKLEALPAIRDDDNQFDPRLSDATFATSSTPPSDYILHFRAQPQIDFSCEPKQLLTNIDVVPCMPARPLIQISQDMIGERQKEAPNTGRIAELLPKIRRSLLGVQVRCSYNPRGQGTKDSEKAIMLDQNQMDGARVFCIRDLKMRQYYQCVRLFCAA